MTYFWHLSQTFARGLLSRHIEPARQRFVAGNPLRLKFLDAGRENSYEAVRHYI
jgi:hypothetical protein